MKEILSVNNEYIKYLLKLKEKKFRQQEKKFLIEGYHLVEEAYKANVLKEVLVIDDITAFNNTNKIKVNESIIKKLSSTITPQKIIGVCEINSNSDLIGDKILLLDNINDPGNLGTIIRSAVGFGVTTIIMGPDCVDLYNDKVIRSTQGAIFRINIIVKNLKEIIKKLKEKEVQIIGTSLESSVFLQNIKKPNRYAIILGNEANGIKQELLDLTDLNVKIEISEQLESLNVAVAGSIIMYYLNN